MNDLIHTGPFDLDIAEQDGTFTLIFQGEPVLTPKGERVKHRTPHLLRHMIEEFDHQGDIGVRDNIIEEPKFFSAYALYGIQKDWIEKGEEELSTQFGEEMLRDGMLFRCAGSEVIDQLYRWEPVFGYLNDHHLILPDLSGHFVDDPEMYSSEDEYREAKEMATPDAEFVTKVSTLYQSLTYQQRSVVMFLHAIHHGVVLFPMVLVQGRCTPNEYASGVIAAHAMIGGVFGDVSSEDHQQMFSAYRDNARTALDYLKYFDEYLSSEEEAIANEIKSGEGKNREFKSTLRWNIRAKKNDDAMTHSCLKTIAAFLNTDGGVLFIGVDDDGNSLGLDLDNFPNEDKFLLHLFNVIKQAMGDTAATLVDAKVHIFDGKKCCRIECAATHPNKPVFVKFKKADEEFFVRTGPGTTKLPPSQIIQYMADRNQPATQDGT
jgi:hypothetical protein